MVSILAGMYFFQVNARVVKLFKESPPQYKTTKALSKGLFGVLY